MAIPTATMGTSRTVSSAGPLAPTSDSLNAGHPTTTSLAELDDAVGLLIRMGRKYLVPLERARGLMGGLGLGTRALEIGGGHHFFYVSTYFDIPGLEAFTPMVYERRQRFEVHTRTYLNPSPCFLEVKARGARSTTVRRHIDYHPDGASRFTGSGCTFVVACLASVGITGPTMAQDIAAVLQPVLTTTHEHTTLHLLRVETRATIDTALTWQCLTPGGHVRATAVARTPQTLRPTYLITTIGNGKPVATAGVVVAETKNSVTPSPAGRALWDAGHRPARISKHATGMALLHPKLPANRWYRTLTHELADLFGINRSNLENIGATCANVSAT